VADVQAGSTGRAVSAQGRRVILRPVEREDFRSFFAWRSDLSEAHLWTTQGRRVVTFEQFVPDFERLLRDSIVFVAEEIASGESIGFARAYNLNLVDDIFYAQMYVAPNYRMRAHVWELAALFSDYLFQYYPLRKIYAEVVAHNEYASELYARIGFKNEGRLRDYVWYDDRFWDWLLLALSREDWLPARERAAILLQVEDDVAKRPCHEGGGVAVDGRSGMTRA